MSMMLARHWRLASSSAIAMLALAACSPPPPPDPVDQARAALEAKLGTSVELRAAFVKRDNRHVVVCGLAGEPPAPDGRMDFFARDFVVVDGHLVTGEFPADQKALVEACVKDIPRSDIPPVTIHDGPPIR